jgi:hypothetical protein
MSNTYIETNRYKGAIDDMIGTEVIRFIFSAIESASIIILSLAIFRIPLKFTGSKILIIAVTLSVVSLFQRDYLHLEDFVTISIIVTHVILFKFIFNFPTFYAILVSITGTLVFAVNQTIFLLLGLLIGITSTELINSSLLHGSTLQLITACANILVSFWLSRKKIGFMFVIKRLDIKHMLNSFNLILSFIILMTLITVQLAVLSFMDNTQIIFALIGLIIALSIALTITYIKNKNDIKEKYERLRK